MASNYKDIIKGLECCSVTDAGGCEECPFIVLGNTCQEDLKYSALLAMRELTTKKEEGDGI